MIGFTHDIKIKLCGLSRLQDIDYVNEFKPDYIGFVFAQSRRQVTPVFAVDLRKKLRSDIKAAGVFVNENIETLVKTALSVNLDIIQLHGDEDEEYIERLRKKLIGFEIWKAARVIDEDSIVMAEKLPCDRLLLDTFSPSAYGGTGCSANLDVIANVESCLNKSFFLAGGLNYSNILSAIQKTNPFGVDISSGIETDGLKDRDKIKELINLLRGKSK
jgi:phosphoribosylanthranilate isomerase